MSYLLCSNLNERTMATSYTMDELLKQSSGNDVSDIKTFKL